MADYIHQSLRDPHSYLVPGFGAIMPVFVPEPSNIPGSIVLPEEDVEAIIAYLLTQ
jgi:hypothetical protein